AAASPNSVEAFDPLSRWLARKPAVSWAIFLLCSLLQVAILVDTALDKSDVIDEPKYVGRAMSQWDVAKSYQMGSLPFWGMAIGIAIATEVRHATATPGLVAEPSGAAYYPMKPHLYAARFSTIFVVFFGGLLLFLSALRFGRGPALVAHVLWCFSPAIL